LADLDKVLDKAIGLIDEGKFKKGLDTALDLFRKEANFQSHGSKIMNVLIDAGKKNPTIIFPEIAKYFKSGANDIARKRILSLFNIFIQEGINVSDHVVKNKIDEWNPWFSLVFILQKSKNQDLMKFAINLTSVFYEHNKLDFIKNYRWLAQIIGTETIYAAEYRTQIKIFDFFKEICYGDSTFIDFLLPAIKKLWKSDVSQVRIELLKAIGNLSLYNLHKFDDYISRIQKLLDEKNLNLRSYIIQALGRFGFVDYELLQPRLEKVLRVTYYPQLVPAIAKVVALHIQEHPEEITDLIKKLFAQKKYKQGLVSLLEELLKMCPNKIGDELVDYLISIEKSKKIVPKLHDLKNLTRHYNLSFRLCPRCFSENNIDDKYCDHDRYPLIHGLPLPPLEELPEEEEVEHFEEGITIADEEEEEIFVEELDMTPEPVKVKEVKEEKEEKEVQEEQGEEGETESEKEKT